jgi:hypothetical protein
MPSLKNEQPYAAIITRINKLYQDYCFDCSLSDQVKHFEPYRHSNLMRFMTDGECGRILDIKQLNTGSYGHSLENEFFDIIVLNCIVDVHRDRNKFTVEQNELIDLICFCNRLNLAFIQDQLKIPCNINLPETLSGEKFTLIIAALESHRHQKFTVHSTGAVSLAAAFLLADVIETNVDLSEKTDKEADEYWHKRYNDAISFATKAVEFTPSLKGSADMLLLHIKAIAGEYYPDIKQRINHLELESDIETFKFYKREPVQALLQYPGSLLAIKSSEVSDGPISQASSLSANRLD